MGYEALNCPQCGGNLEFDDTKEYMKCPYCGSTVAKKEARIYCNGHQDITINGGTVNINITSDDSKKKSDSTNWGIDWQYWWNTLKPWFIGVVVFIILVSLIKSCSSKKDSKTVVSASTTVSVTESSTVATVSKETEIIIEPEEPAEIITEIEGTEFDGTFDTEDQVNKYLYTAPVSGHYYFAFDISDVTCSYDFEMRNSKREKVGSSYSWCDGTNVDLEEGETYTIEVGQYSGFADYTISIGIPNEPSDVEGDSFAGTIRFYEQADTYYYEAPVTGRYYFAFDISDVTEAYSVEMRDRKKNRIGSSYSWSDGLSADLEQGEIYTIVVEQYSGTFDYEVTIGIPNEPENVDGDTIEGVISYKGQINTYYYVAPRTGSYTLSFTYSDKNTGYSFEMRSPKNERVLSAYSWSGKKSVDLVEGETYSIKMEEYSGYCEYSITITPEK